MLLNTRNKNIDRTVINYCAINFCFNMRRLQDYQAGMMFNDVVLFSPFIFKKTVLRFGEEWSLLEVLAFIFLFSRKDT
jgi:hypothetical protein